MIITNKLLIELKEIREQMGNLLLLWNNFANRSEQISMPKITTAKITNLKSTMQTVIDTLKGMEV